MLKAHYVPGAAIRGRDLLPPHLLSEQIFFVGDKLPQ